MTPRPADENIREALISEAARLLREGGTAALSARRLAALVGASTTAVYTHFGSMDELRRAVRMEGFTRLAGWLERVPVTADPLADMVAVGSAYVGNARANPNLYRAMFLDETFDEAERELCFGTFARLVEATERCVQQGVIDRQDSWEVSLELWAVAHGVVSLLLAQMWTDEEALARFAAVGRTILLGMGVSEDDVRRAIGYSAQFLLPLSTPDRETRARPAASA